MTAAVVEQPRLRVSVALTTYNGARYLDEQLQSYERQSRQPDEVIVCDDGSSDDTVAILERFRSRVPFRVEIVRNPKNLGFTKNFEKAIALCSGDVIFFSDQDDVWLPGKLAAVMDCFAANPGAMVVVHDGELVNERLEFHGATKLRQVRGGFGTTDALVVGALSAMRASFLPYALPIPEGVVGHDIWFHRLAGLLGARVVLEESLQKIRRHGSNTSDWIASSVEPINRADVWLSHMRTTPAADYGDRMVFNSAAAERVALAQARSSPFPKERIDTALAQLRLEKEALLEREALLRAGFVGRKIRAARMLVRGSYGQFNGLGSFLRDLLR